jgi:ribonuclease D
MIVRLRDAPAVAVDTESDSLHVYFEKVCLVQFSIPGTDYLVDPLAIDVTPLGDMFASEDQQKVFHAAEYDIICMKRSFGFTIANLFDTMIAARVLGWQRCGLGPILQERFSLKLNKRMQRYNWGTRPLPDAALEYARLDTHFLLSLRDLQISELEDKGRLVEAQQAFQRQVGPQSPPKAFDPDNFWRIRGARDLGHDKQAVLRRLYIFRDGLASTLNLPPFKVIGDACLVHLANASPSSRRALARVKGVSHRIRTRYADQLLEAIAAGLTSPPPLHRHNSRPRLSDRTLARYEALRAWRKGVAEAREVEPDVVLPNLTLMEVARRNPATVEALAQVEALDDWQRETYGQALLQMLKEHTT